MTEGPEAELPPRPSPATLERLALMAAMLADLAAAYRDKVTSNDLARWLGTTAATVRKDIGWTRGGPSGVIGRSAYHPGEGPPAGSLGGTAYPVAELALRIQAYLHPEPRVPLKTGLAGLSDAGLAFASDLQREPEGPYRLLAGFDSRANRLEQLEVTFPLWPTTDITAVSLKLGLEAAILMVPAGDAQRVAERFVQGGVRRLVNYSSAVLRLNRRQVWVRECGVFTGA
ncbi:MAG: winged-helix domain-containing protein [Spirochaetales bacterium]